ncbi:MAG: hypothetical protein ACXVX8_06630 [Blastococcus sp.]
MTEPSSARPVPGPPRPGPGSTEPGAPDGEAAPVAERAEGEPFTGLEAKPVAEHVAVFEAEHSRLQRELGTIDQL